MNPKCSEYHRLIYIWAFACFVLLLLLCSCSSVLKSKQSASTKQHQTASAETTATTVTKLDSIGEQKYTESKKATTTIVFDNGQTYDIGQGDGGSFFLVDSSEPARYPLLGLRLKTRNTVTINNNGVHATGGISKVITQLDEMVSDIKSEQKQKKDSIKTVSHQNITSTTEIKNTEKTVKRSVWRGGFLLLLLLLIVVIDYFSGFKICTWLMKQLQRITSFFHHKKYQ